jgi:hypothetical protein
LEAFLKGLCEQKGTLARENLTYDRYVPIFINAQKYLTWNAGIDSPSVFKRGAAFLLAFLAESPLICPFSGTNPVYKHKNHMNAIAAFEFVRFGLVNALIDHETRGPLVLKEPIIVSAHYYADLVHALSHLPKDDSAFHVVSILIESLAYSANPDAQDTPRG